MKKIQLADRMATMQASAVREILKVAERPDILSFAGGLPAPELFPIDAIAHAHAAVFANEGEAALQYSITEGFAPLREWIVERQRANGVPAEVSRTLITSGSQQGIDLVGKILINPGDLVAVEDPSYLAALQSFGGYQAQLASVRSDDEGMCTDSLAELLATKKVRLIYIVPNFQNPKGTTLSLRRRHALIELAQKHHVPILEDDPYGELRFEGTALPSLAALDTTGLVINLGTFSKTLAPGLRIGWALGSREMVRALTVAKQAADLHTATVAQRATAELLRHFDYDGHLAKIRQVYGERQRVLVKALEQHMPEGTHWTRPEGGLFVWLRLPGGLRAEELFDAALAEGVAFVPGSPFFANTADFSTLRLNFSNRPPELLRDGMERLGRVAARAAEPKARKVQSA
ncbi:MAG: aminotransferase-like domain-containing protein [Myxococcaceae bacterium]